jgi:hypothetical protein
MSMLDKNYWEDVVKKLTDAERANWAAHAISTNLENLKEILRVAGRENVIAACLTCYSIYFTAQPYLDEILDNFTVKELIGVYKKLGERPIQTAGALMWLLEDIDPEFKWAKSLP